MSEIVRGMPMAEYQAVKALSASGAFVLSEECPARFWARSPWNEDAVPSETRREFDVGSALHFAVLEPELAAEQVVVIDAKDYRTKQAQSLRDDAYAAGKTPILTKELGLIVAMDKAIHADPYAAALLAAGKASDSEVSYFWDDEVTGTPCKARVDRLAHNGSVLIDIKTAETAAPRAWQAKAFREGHFLRAAWYLDGWELASGQCPKRYVFIVVEKEPPHIVMTYELGGRALEWGRMVMRRALNRFAECRVANKWREAYGPSPTIIDLPVYAEHQLADREQAGEFSRTIAAADVRRGFNYLAP